MIPAAILSHYRHMYTHAQICFLSEKEMVRDTDWQCPGTVRQGIGKSIRNPEKALIFLLTTHKPWVPVVS